jgi:hypothetical protein
MVRSGGSPLGDPPTSRPPDRRHSTDCREPASAA